MSTCRTAQKSLTANGIGLETALRPVPGDLHPFFARLRPCLSPIRRRLTIFFNDGSKLNATFPRQPEGDPSVLASQAGKAIDADKLALEIQVALFIVPMRNVKYIQVMPAPEALPRGVIRGATLLP